MHAYYIPERLKVEAGIQNGVNLNMPPANQKWRDSPLAMSKRSIYLLLQLGVPILMSL